MTAPGLAVDEVVQAKPYAICGAKKRQSEGVCQKQAGWGTTHLGSGVCRLHGGATINHVKHAGKERALRAASTLHAAVPRPDAQQVLLDELWRSQAVVVWLEDEIAALKKGELAQVNSARTSVPAFLLALYQQERDRLTKVAALCLSSGIAERQIKVLEAQARQIADVLQRIYADLALPAEYAQRWPEIVRTRLAALSVPDVVEIDPPRD